MTTPSLATAERFVAAINAHNGAALAALMTLDHRFIDSLGAGVTGAERVREAWTTYFQMVPDYGLEITQRLVDAADVVLLGVARGSYATEGRVIAGCAWSTPVAIRARIRDNQVAEWQVFADNEPIREQMRRASPTSRD